MTVDLLRLVLVIAVVIGTQVWSTALVAKSCVALSRHVVLSQVEARSSLTDDEKEEINAYLDLMVDVPIVIRARWLAVTPEVNSAVFVGLLSLLLTILGIKFNEFGL